MSLTSLILPLYHFRRSIMGKFTITETNTNLDQEKFYTYVDNTDFSDEIKKFIKGMLGVIVPSEENDITLNFVDFQKIMSYGGVTFSGIGEHEGENSATEAIKLAIKNSFLDYDLMCKISGILIHFTIHPDLPIIEIAEVMEIIDENAHYEADIIWGTTTDESVSEKYVKATILFTGFDNMVVNNIEFKE